MALGFDIDAPQCGCASDDHNDLGPSLPLQRLEVGCESAEDSEQRGDECRGADGGRR